MHTDSNSHILSHKLLHDNFSLLYIYQAALVFAKSMIGIFIPVYLYKLNFSIIEILIYISIISFLYLALIPITIKIINKIGFKYTLLLSVPIYILHIISISYVLESKLNFYLAATLFGIYISLFWPCMHFEIIKRGNNKNRANELGNLQIISIIVSTLAPFIGGYILEDISYYYLILIVSFIILIGTLPLIFSKDIKLNHYNFNYKDYYRLYKISKKSKEKYAFISEGIFNTLVITLWPITLFILFNQSYVKLGMLFTIISLIAVLVMIYIKKYLDEHPKEKILKSITRFLSIHWFLRLFVLEFGIFYLYFIESLAKLLQNIFNISYYSIFYNNAKKSSYMDYVILRELYLHITKIIFIFFILIPILYFFGQDIKILVFLSVFGIIISNGLSYLNEK